MSLRIGGYAAIVGGILWFVALAGNAINDGAESGARPRPGVLVAATILTLVALVGLSAFQARRHPALVWAAFAIPAVGAVIALARRRRDGRHRRQRRPARRWHDGMDDLDHRAADAARRLRAVRDRHLARAGLSRGAAALLGFGAILVVPRSPGVDPAASCRRSLAPAGPRRRDPRVPGRLDRPSASAPCASRSRPHHSSKERPCEASRPSRARRGRPPRARRHAGARQPLPRHGARQRPVRRAGRERRRGRGRRCRSPCSSTTRTSTSPPTRTGSIRSTCSSTRASPVSTRPIAVAGTPAAATRSARTASSTTDPLAPATRRVTPGPPAAGAGTSTIALTRRTWPMTATRPERIPSIATRALGVVGILGGLGLLAAFVVEIPSALEHGPPGPVLCGCHRDRAGDVRTSRSGVEAACPGRHRPADRRERLVHRVDPARRRAGAAVRG